MRVIPIADRHNDKAREFITLLRDKQIRCDIDTSPETFGKKIRNAKTEYVPYFIILGDKDIEVGKVTLESRDHGAIGQVTIEEAVERIAKEIKEKK